MPLYSLVILLVCIGLMAYAVYYYVRSFIAHWMRNETWRPDGKHLAKLEQKQENMHRFNMKEGFHGEDDSKNT